MQLVTVFRSFSPAEAQLIRSRLDAADIAALHDTVVTTTSAIVSTLTANTAYYYRVRAVGPPGTSGYSNTASVNTLAADGSGG